MGIKGSRNRVKDFKSYRKVKMKPTIEEGFKKEMYNDLHNFVMKQTDGNADLSWHDKKSNLAKYLCNKGWVKEEK